MTWPSFFSLAHSSYPHNLAYAYGAVWVIQGGYVAWIVRNWSRPSPKRNS